MTTSLPPIHASVPPAPQGESGVEVRADPLPDGGWSFTVDDDGNGRIWAEPRPGGGARLRFELYADSAR